MFPNGSLLCLRLCIIFIKYIVNEIGYCIPLFADNTSLFISVEDFISSEEHLNDDPVNILQWAEAWLVTFNHNKTESLIISRKTNKPFKPPLYMNTEQVEEVDCHKHLRLHLSNDCTYISSILAFYV